MGVGYLFTAALAKLSLCSLPWMRGISSLPPFVTFNVRWLLYTLLHHATTAHWKWGGSSQPPPLASDTGQLLSAIAFWRSQPLPLTSDVGQLLLAALTVQVAAACA